MKKDEILSVIKELNNNFGPDDEILTIEINEIKYNISIIKLKRRFPNIEISEVRNIFGQNHLELPEIKPNLKKASHIQKSNTSMLIDLINIAHNKPLNNKTYKNPNNSKELNNRNIKIATSIIAASFLLFLTMFFIEKNSEKNYKYVESKRATKPTTEAFNRKKLQQATNRKFVPSTAKSKLQERKIMRDNYTPPRPPAPRVAPNVRKPANDNPEPLRIRQDEIVENAPPPHDDNPYPNDDYEPYPDENTDPYYEDMGQPPPGDDPYLDNPYPD